MHIIYGGEHMARGDYRAQIRERDYKVEGGRNIKVAELNPVARYSTSNYEEWLLNTRVRQVGMCAFHATDAHGLLTMPQIQRYQLLQNTADELRRLKHGLRYVVALQGEDALLASQDAPDTDAVAAYARVETWRKGTGVGKLFGEKYPVLTEFNTADGQLTGRFKPAAAATLHYSLIESEIEAPVGLQVAEADRDGIAYFEGHGFEVKAIVPATNGYGMDVQMMTVPGIDRLDVQRSLESAYPFLAANSAPPFNA